MRTTLTPRAVNIEYEAGLKFNNGINLYDTVSTNENFFLGKQWEGVKSNGLPTPVFNFLKRVVLFSVANVSTDNLKLHAKPLPSTGNVPTRTLEIFSTILGHSIFSWCLKFFSPSFVSASKLCEPVVAAIMAGFLFGELPGWLQVIGGGLILGGVLWYSRIEGKQSESP